MIPQAQRQAPTWTRRRLLRPLASHPQSSLQRALSGVAPRVDRLPLTLEPEASVVPPSPKVHVLERLTYGPRQVELDRLNRLGIAGFIEEQLHPETLDDTATERRVRRLFPDLDLDVTDMFRLAETDEDRFYRLPGRFQEAALYRAMFSRRQLHERMVEFWSDHFNIYLYKDFPWFKVVDDREVIRRHALGKFRDLLHASARSPAMLYYLDNYANTQYGPNENYARELMELHTLGVDGGYTQADVVEVSRCLTGWTIDFERNFGHFRFSPDDHDFGTKVVLGHAIPGGSPGILDGVRVLNLLADHPATARFIATKLCRRFVADQPPATVIDAAAATFLATDGDIRAVLRTILLSTEFMAAAGSRLKRPLDFVVSALRGLRAAVDTGGLGDLNYLLFMLGQAPFEWEPPNGYPDVGPAWANTNGLLNRWNLATLLAFNYLSGVRVDHRQWIAGLRPRTPAKMVDSFARRLLRRPITADDRQRLESYAAAGGDPHEVLSLGELQAIAPGLMALLLSSPSFQWR